jgi:hypothetical protein
MKKSTKIILVLFIAIVNNTLNAALLNPVQTKTSKADIRYTAIILDTLTGQNTNSGLIEYLVRQSAESAERQEERLELTIGFINQRSIESGLRNEYVSIQNIYNYCRQHFPTFTESETDFYLKLVHSPSLSTIIQQGYEQGLLYNSKK